MKSGKGTAAALAAAAGLASGLLAVASPTAQAASLPAGAKVASRSTFVIPPGKATSVTTGGSTLRVTAALSGVTTCSLTAYQPYRYYTNPSGGGETGFAIITCNQPVVSLSLSMALYRNNVQVASNSDSNSDSSSITVSADYPVVASGAYRTSASGAWAAYDNSGYLPQQYSSTAYYSCC